MLLLIDNYDSFTWNLVHYLRELGQEVRVARNDSMTVEACLAAPVETLVISPGPCDPRRSGICLDLIAANAARPRPLPTLGVCLGHQAIGEAFGGRVIRAPAPMHGKVSSITHQGGGVLRSIPSPFAATRYHSLVVEEESFPSCLEILAKSDDDGMVMALRHKRLPFHGVQFHPESIASAHGHEILRNFLERDTEAARAGAS